MTRGPSGSGRAESLAFVGQGLPIEREQGGRLRPQRIVRPGHSLPEELLQLVADDAAHLLFVPVLLRPRTLVRPEAEGADHAPGRVKPRVAEEPRPQLEVAGQPIPFVDLSPRALPQRAPPEGGLLLDVAVLTGQEPQPVPAPRGIGGYRGAIRGEVARLGRQPLHVLERAEDLGQQPQRAPVQHVVRVEPAHDLARGPCEAFVEGVRVAAVGLARPGREPGLVPADHIDGPVLATAVHDHVLEVGVALLQHGTDRLVDGGRVVQAGRDQADARRAAHVTTTSAPAPGRPRSASCTC